MRMFMVNAARVVSRESNETVSSTFTEALIIETLKQLQNPNYKYHSMNSVFDAEILDAVNRAIQTLSQRDGVTINLDGVSTKILNSKVNNLPNEFSNIQSKLEKIFNESNTLFQESKKILLTKPATQFWGDKTHHIVFDILRLQPKKNEIANVIQQLPTIFLRAVLQHIKRNFSAEYYAESNTESKDKIEAFLHESLYPKSRKGPENNSR